MRNILYRTLLSVAVVAFPLSVASAQPVHGADSDRDISRLERTGTHFYEGITEMLSWHDIPFGALHFANHYSYFDNPDDKPFQFQALDFERDLAGTVGVPGSRSIGNIHPEDIANIVLLSRTAYTIGEDMLTEKGSSKKSYKHAFGLYKAMAYTEVSTQVMKNIVNRSRPDASDTKSFFSGHTSLSFAMCSFMQREVDDLLVHWDVLADEDWRRVARIGGFALFYGWASYVGYSRMRDNKHYFSDVLIGALIGTLFGNFVYDTYLADDDSILKNIGVGSNQGAPSVNISLGL